MIDEADKFSDGWLHQEPKFMTFDHRAIAFPTGSIRMAEHPSIIADRNINKHQEKITHNDTCKCKEFEYDDLVVMFFHIEQYPQFRCYCKWCIGKLQAEIDPNVTSKYTQDQTNDAFRILLAEAIVEKGIDLKKW